MLHISTNPDHGRTFLTKIGDFRFQLQQPYAHCVLTARHAHGGYEYVGVLGHFDCQAHLCDYSHDLTWAKFEPPQRRLLRQ